jgi:hypothetical protein
MTSARGDAQGLRSARAGSLKEGEFRVNQVDGRGLIDVAGGPVFVSPPCLCCTASVVALIVTVVTPASMTLADGPNRRKPLQQLPFVCSSRP